MEVNKIYLGNTLDVLKTFPDESINCCVTSPPYWALRDYGTDGVIWDGDPDCEHEWESNTQKMAGGMISYRERLQRDAGLNTSKYIGNHEDKNKDVVSNLCNKCGAWKGQLGLEPDFNLYIKHLCDIFDEVKRVLRKDGTCWVNLGDTYSSGQKGGGGKNSEKVKIKGQENFQSFEPRDFDCGGLPDKSLCNIPSRFSIEMQNRGWILRNKIIWHKPNCMPSSVTDRFTVDFEEIFFFVKNKKYWFEQQFEPHTRLWDESNGGNLKESSTWAKDAKALQKGQHKGKYPLPNENGRNKRTVWKIPTQPFPEAHFAVFPEALVETPIKAGCPKDGIVLDPFMGSGTVALKALKENRNFIGIEINPDYIDMAYNRIRPLLSQSKLFEEELICRV